MSTSDTFCQSGAARFINSVAGRIVRVVVGLCLVAWGFALREDAIGILFMMVGIVPLLAGVFDLCMLSAFLGGPVTGAEVRAIRRKA